MKELKPCPFCGAEVNKSGVYKRYIYHSEDCYISKISNGGVPTVSSVMEESWNSRPPAEKDILKAIYEEIDAAKNYGDLDETLIPGIEVVEEIIKLKGYDYSANLMEEHHLPQEEVCPECDGDGYNYDDSEEWATDEKCPYCNGTGKKQTEQVTQFRKNLDTEIDEIIDQEQEPEEWFEIVKRTEHNAYGIQLALSKISKLENKINTKQGD